MQVQSAKAEDPAWPVQAPGPEGRLALLPAGPDLGQAMAAIDRTTLDGYGLVLLLQAVPGRSRMFAAISHKAKMRSGRSPSPTRAGRYGAE